MSRKSIRQRTLFIALLILCASASTVLAQEQAQPEERVLPAQTTVWEAYGLSFNLPQAMRETLSTDTHWKLQASDMDLDVVVLDRYTYTDEELGKEVVECVLRGGMNLAEARIIKFENGALQGGGIIGKNEYDSDVIALCVENIDTAYAFLILIQNADGQEAKGKTVLDFIKLHPPGNLIVR